jgi:hypothetical protein
VGASGGLGDQIWVSVGPVGLICIGELQVKLINRIIFFLQLITGLQSVLHLATIRIRSVPIVAGTGAVFLNNLFSAYQSRGFYTFPKSEN